MINNNGDYHGKSVTHTGKADGPWLEIDLGSEQKNLDRILVYNRTDGGTGNRPGQFWTVVLNANRQPVWAHLSKKTPSPKWEGKLPKTHEEFFESRQGFPHISYLTIDRSSPGDERSKKLKDLEKKLAGHQGPTVPIFRELPKDKPQSPAHLRGSYLNLGGKVEAGFPTSLFAATEGVKNQTEWILASGWWMKNPLTARVAANRFGKRYLA